MSRRCFFTESVNPSVGQAILEDRSAHHARNVLRLKPGAEIELRDGRGQGWKGRILDMSESRVSVQLLDACDDSRESRLELTLGIAFARADRMDLVLRQATEIGLSRFVAFQAERSDYGLSSGQAEKRLHRWSKIAREAMCQCGRMRVPEMAIHSNTVDFLAKAHEFASPERNGLRILAAEKEAGQNVLSLWRSCPMYRQVLAVVGPEGGWTPAEIDQFLQKGFHPVHLGPRILRFETAATVLLSSVQTLWGDFGQPG